MPANSDSLPWSVARLGQQGPLAQFKLYFFPSAIHLIGYICNAL